MKEIKHFFGVPMLFGNFGCTKKFIRPIEEKPCYKYQPGKFKHRKANGHGTVDRQILSTYKPLCNLITPFINEYLYDVIKLCKTHTYTIASSWGNIHYNNDWSHKHNHETSDFSGCCYIKCNPDSGNINFYKPYFHYNLLQTQKELRFSEETDLNTEKISITPIDGDIILFPSFVAHDVDTNISDETRISLAFDITIN